MGCFIFSAAAATSEVENLQTTSAPSEGCSSHSTWGSPQQVDRGRSHQTVEFEVVGDY
jgi:hypothetical protein